MNQLGADPSIVRREIRLGERTVTVVGVADRVHSVPTSIGMPPAFWTTLAMHAELWTGSSKAQREATRAALKMLKSTAGADPTKQDRVKALDEDLSAPAPQWNPAVDVFGRIKARVTRAHAQAELGAIAAVRANNQGSARMGQPPMVKLESLNQQDRDATIITTILQMSSRICVPSARRPFTCR